MAQVNCPSCDAALEIDAAPGTEFDCGACGAAMLMPDIAPARPQSPRSPAARPGAARPLAAGASAARPGGARRLPAAAPAAAGGGANKQKAVLFVALGVVVLVVIAVIVIKSGNNNDPVPNTPSNTNAPGKANANNSGKPDPKAGVADPEAGGTVKSPTPAPKPVPKPEPPKKRPPRPNDVQDKIGALRWDMEAPEAKVEAYTVFAAYAARSALELELEGKAVESEALSKDARAAAEGALKIDPENDAARALTGFVRFDKAAAQRMLGETWMRPFFKADLELAIPDTDREAGSPPKPVWLDCKSGPQKDAALRWRELMRRADRWRKTALDPENDRFAKSALKRFNELEKEVGEKLKKKGSEGATSFEVFTFKPYVLYVQKDAKGDEDRIAEKWIDLLEEVKNTFYLRFRRRHNFDELDEITPVLVLRSFEEYKKYNDGKNQNAAAHFEPGTGRLVTWTGAFGRDNATDETVDASGMTVKYIRGSVFHEATHQLVHFITRLTGRERAGGQAMWFSEGIADYFGFHSRHVDPDTGRWRYQLGKISDERIGSLAMYRKNLMEFTDLLDYLRSDFSSDNGTLFGDREKNAGDMVRARRRTALAYAQGWSFVYFLNEFDNRKYRDKFDDYLKGERVGQSGPSAFKRVFGNDLSKMQTEYFGMVDEFIEALKENRIENGAILPKGSVASRPKK